jgi:hypothetical protein
LPPPVSSYRYAKAPTKVEGSAKARGRAFAHAESGDNLLAKDRWLGFRNGMAGSWRQAGKEERSPPVNQRRATPLFRVREGPSPRLLRAKVNGKTCGWPGEKDPLLRIMECSLRNENKSDEDRYNPNSAIGNLPFEKNPGELLVPSGVICGSFYKKQITFSLP